MVIAEYINERVNAATNSEDEVGRNYSIIESLLFVAGRPLSLEELAKTSGLRPRQVLQAIDELQRQYKNRGIRIQRIDSMLQLVSAPENAGQVANLLGVRNATKLTQAALESLAVVAYKQPVTRAQVESIRGVNSDRALATLLAFGFIAEAGKAELPGRPTLLVTTPEFLQQFGISHLDELPMSNLLDSDAQQE